MSFGYSIGDAITLVQLAWRTVEGARKACGEHDDLTTEVLRHHAVLAHVQSEISDPASAINHSDDSRTAELRRYISGCERHLRSLELILDRYNSLSDAERSIKKLWHKVRFGNGEVQNVAAIRRKVMTYTSAISMTLQLVSMGSQGRMEQRLRRQGGDLEGISQSVNLILARLNIESGEGSIMTDYTGDDRAFWRDLRRELVMEGYKSSSLRKHKDLIKAYVMELGAKGVLDEETKGKEGLTVVQEKAESSGESDSPIVNDQDDLPGHTSLSSGPTNASGAEGASQIPSESGQSIEDSDQESVAVKPAESRAFPAIEDKPGPSSNGSQTYRSPYVEDGSDASETEAAGSPDGGTKQEQSNETHTRDFIGPEDVAPSIQQKPSASVWPMSTTEPDDVPTSTPLSDCEASALSDGNAASTAPLALLDQPYQSQQDPRSPSRLETCWVYYAHPYVNDLLTSSPLSKYGLRRRFHVFKQWSPSVSEEFRAKLHNGYSHFESTEAWKREAGFMHKIKGRFKNEPDLNLIERLQLLEMEFYYAVCRMPVLPMPNALRMVSMIQGEDLLYYEPVRQIWEIGEVRFHISGTIFNARSLSCWLYDWGAYRWGMESIKMGRVKAFASQLISFDDSFGRLCCQILTCPAPFGQDQWNLIDQGDEIWHMFEKRCLQLSSSAEAFVAKEARAMHDRVKDYFGPGRHLEPNLARPIEVFYLSTLEESFDEATEWGWKELSAKMRDWCAAAKEKSGIGIFEPVWP